MSASDQGAWAGNGFILRRIAMFKYNLHVLTSATELAKKKSTRLVRAFSSNLLCSTFAHGSHLFGHVDSVIFDRLHTGEYVSFEGLASLIQIIKPLPECFL
jgi:hypothetical protein